MDKFLEIFLPIVSTVLTGVTVFVLGQIILEVWIKPTREYLMLKSKISFALVYYANFYSNPLVNTKNNEKYNKGSEEIRKLAAELEGYKQRKPIFTFPRKKNLEIAIKELIGISNGFYGLSNHLDRAMENNIKSRNKIKKVLRFK